MAIAVAAAASSMCRNDHHPFASPISGTRRRRSWSIIDRSSIPVPGP
jgi:hypothetical protein